VPKIIKFCKFIQLVVTNKNVKTVSFDLDNSLTIDRAKPMIRSGIRAVIRASCVALLSGPTVCSLLLLSLCTQGKINE